MFSLFTSKTFSEVEYKSYKKLPCSFNGAKVSTSAKISFKRSSRCSDYKGYPLKRGTSVLVKRGTPIFAITDMKLLYAKDRSAKQRSKIYNKTQKKQGTDYIFDDVELMFVDKNKNQILFFFLWIHHSSLVLAKEIVKDPSNTQPKNGKDNLLIVVVIRKK